MNDLIQNLSFEVRPAISRDITMRECMDLIKKAIDDSSESYEGIQTALVAASAVAFNVDYHKKNVQPFTLLIQGLRGNDRQAIVAWVESHAPAILRTGKDGRKGFVFNNSFKGEFDYDVLMAEKWYDYAKPERALKSTIDFREQLDNLVKRLTREMEAEVKKDIAHPEVLGELKALQGRLSAAAY